MKVAVCIGTRPDTIKVWPVYKALLENRQLNTILIHSGQHDELAQQAAKCFNLIPDYYLILERQDKPILGFLSASLIREFTEAFLRFKPDLVLVHGDTVTAFSGAAAAFQLNIPIGHIEAGLRTSRFEYPFPEEGYRRAISRFTTLHFAPTAKSAQNLREEGINKGVYVTGNTVVDALKYVITKPRVKEIQQTAIDLGINNILVTCHRRESWGKPLEDLCESIIELTIPYEDRIVHWPIHSNPQVSDRVIAKFKPLLLEDKIDITQPADYDYFIGVLSSCKLCITDSGGVMEEAAVLGIPTLVLRTETERPEVLDLDNVQLVGYNYEELISKANEWLNNPPIRSQSSAFGDGTAGQEIADIIQGYFNERV